MTPTVPTAQIPAAHARSSSSEAGVVTPQPVSEQKIIGREEQVEYRDQDGNLLNDEQVAALEKDGKVTFKTKYETKTRLVDEAGNEIQQQYAPEHPDAEGQNPDTKGVPERKGQSSPASAAVEKRGSKGKDKSKAQPASDANEATK